jgi:hypothetical protein
MRRAISLLVVVSVFGATGLALAQGKKSDAAAAAKEKSGRELLSKGEYDAAISDLLAAYELANKPELLYLVGKAYDQKGDDPVGAKTYYEQYLAASGGNPPELAEIQGRISAIDSALAAKRAAAGSANNGSLKLEVEQSGAVIEIEDKQVGTSPLTAPLSYPTGSYTVRVTKPGFKEYLAVLDVEAGDTTNVKISLEKEGKPRWGLWAVVVLGVVAGGAGTSVFLLNNAATGNNGDAVAGSDLGTQRF